MSGKHYAKMVSVHEVPLEPHLPGCSQWVAKDSEGRTFRGDTREEAVAMCERYNSRAPVSRSSLRSAAHTSKPSTFSTQSRPAA